MVGVRMLFGVFFKHRTADEMRIRDWRSDVCSSDLYLRPGLDILQKAGGLHGFNGWTQPILTDSGGYQVFSLSETRKIREEGVNFRSHIDGSRHLFTPENTMDTQRTIGADNIMADRKSTRLNSSP